MPAVLTLLHNNESAGIFRGAVRLLGALDPPVLSTHLPMLAPLLKNEDHTVQRLVLSAMRKCAQHSGRHLARPWLEDVVHLAVRPDSASGTGTGASVSADDLVVRTSAVRVLSQLEPGALAPHIPDLMPLLSDYPRTRHVLGVSTSGIRISGRAPALPPFAP